MQKIDIFPGYEILASEKSDGDFSDRSHMPQILRPARQVHGTHIHTITEDLDIGDVSADGLYTREKNITISALQADCPIVLIMGDGEIASVHSGWRGTKLSIVTHALTLFETSRDQMRVYIGPHIGRDSYEVQSDFLDHFPRKYFHFVDEKIFFDITAKLYDDLIASGIGDSHIVISNIDTYTDENYWSYRGDKTAKRGVTAIKIC